MQEKVNVNGQNHVVETGNMKAEMTRISNKGYSEDSCYEHSFGAL